MSITMFDAYLDLPLWLRLIVALVALVAGVLLATIGWMHCPQFEDQVLANDDIVHTQIGGEYGAAPAYRAGFVLTGIGGFLLVTSGRSASEKNGYNF